MKDSPVREQSQTYGKQKRQGATQPSAAFRHSVQCKNRLGGCQMFLCQQAGESDQMKQQRNNNKQHLKDYVFSPSK